MDTPNKRLARVLRLLADVAERGIESGAAANFESALGDAWFAAKLEPDSIVFCELNLERAERLATEAALLAGVPVDGWRRPTAVPVDEFVLVTVRDLDINGGKPYVCEAILCESQDEGTYEWCIRPDYNGEVEPQLRGSVLAWRPLPEPYRPEEQTDEQR